MVVMIAVAACQHGHPKEVVPLADPVLGGDRPPVEVFTRELGDEVLDSYDRDDPPETESGMLNGAIGGARIGVGPGDVLFGGELGRAPSRWPLFVDRSDATKVRSKRLELHLAADLSAAWTFDELSWRIVVCGRVAVIPLRVTALYAHDGDRWVPVYEHLSFGHAGTPRADGALRGRTMAPAVASREVADALSRTLAPVLAGTVGPAQRATIAIGPEAVLLGPDFADEWHGPDLLGARLLTTTRDGVAAPIALRAEDRRIGTVGRSVAKSTIAYWIGNLVADLPPRGDQPAGKLRYRGTFAFERRDGQWVMVAGHVSAPIDDEDLARQVFGSSLLGLNPLRIACEGEPRPVDPAVRDLTAPAAARDRAPPPAGQTR
jgi:hypothetical protein